MSRQNRQPRRSEAEPRWIVDREIWAGWLVVVRDQGALDGRADLPVAPDDGVERQQALDIAGPQAGGDAAAVAFEAELVLRVQMIASMRWRSQFGKYLGVFSSVRAGRIRVSSRPGLVKN